MPELLPPDTRVHRSFVRAMDELRAEGRGGPDDGSSTGRAIRAFGSRWHEPGMFAAYVAALRAEAREETARPEDQVPCTTLWYVDGERYLGRLAIRHTLNGWLLEWGGHIGYDVRPSQRRRGHATRMLRAALPVARGLGIDAALVTCDTGNIASRKVIEAAGGVLEDERSGKLRYWVSTREAPRAPGAHEAGSVR